MNDRNQMFIKHPDGAQFPSLDSIGIREEFVRNFTHIQHDLVTTDKKLRNPSDHRYFKPGKAKEYCRDYIFAFRALSKILLQEYDVLKDIFEAVKSQVQSTSISGDRDQHVFERMRLLRKKLGQHGLNMHTLQILNALYHVSTGGHNHLAVEDMFMSYVLSLNTAERDLIKQQIEDTFVHTQYPESVRTTSDAHLVQLTEDITFFGRILRRLEALSSINYFQCHTLDKHTESLRSLEVTCDDLVERIRQSGGLVSGVYEGSADKLGLGNGYQVYVCVPRQESLNHMAELVSKPVEMALQILLFPSDHLLNSLTVSGRIKPLSYDEFQKHYFDPEAGYRLRNHHHGIGLYWMRYMGGTVDVSADVPFYGGSRYCEVHQLYRMENAIITHVLEVLARDTSRFSELIAGETDDGNIPPSGPRESRAHKIVSLQDQTPFTFPIPGLTSHTTTGILSHSVRDQVRNTTLGWPVVLPSGHLPELETLKRNQTFFPDYPGAPEVRMSIYHAQRHDNGQLLSEMEMHWPLTDVASDRGYYLSFVQGILGGIEYLNATYSDKLDIIKLRKLGTELQEKTSAYILAYDDSPENFELQQAKNIAFLKDVIRPTLRSINTLSPDYQIRCKTHALPEQFDRDAQKFTPQRLGRSGNVLQFNVLDTTQSDAEKRLMTEIPLRTAG